MILGIQQVNALEIWMQVLFSKLMKLCHPSDCRTTTNASVDRLRLEMIQNRGDQQTQRQMQYLPWVKQLCLVVIIYYTANIQIYNPSINFHKKLEAAEKKINIFQLELVIYPKCKLIIKGSKHMITQFRFPVPSLTTYIVFLTCIFNNSFKNNHHKLQKKFHSRYRK